MDMKEKIDHFLKQLGNITKEQADWIEEVLTWDDETKAGFLFAKRIFEEVQYEDEKPK